MIVSSFEEQLEDLLNFDISNIIAHNRSRFDELAGSFGDSIVLFGAGPLGRKTLLGLRSLNIVPLAFADNNPSLWNTSIEGLNVLAPNEAVGKFGNNAVFVVTIYNGSAVRRQLRGMGCKIALPFAYLFWKYHKIFLPHGGLDLPNSIYAQAEDVKRALSLWADDSSKIEYLAQLRWRLLLDFDSLPAHLPASETYFPGDLVSLSDDEIFVDCGAFDGDTIKNFLRRREASFGKVVAIEPDPANYKKLQEFIPKLPAEIRGKVISFQFAVGAIRGKVPFAADGTMGSIINKNGNIMIECARLDDIFRDYLPTYVKLDIEGAEPQALIGAKRLIEQNSTVWVVCVYHQQDHLWKIPLYINSLSGDYRIFLRRYAEECWETVCYAIPAGRIGV
ncbi:MAG: FkbM family methyltransferase [Thermodesulfovibrionales bacterium]|jgi:FkbM family methyltransferase